MEADIQKPFYQLSCFVGHPVTKNVFFQCVGAGSVFARYSGNVKGTLVIQSSDPPVVE